MTVTVMWGEMVVYLTAELGGFDACCLIIVFFAIQIVFELPRTCMIEASTPSPSKTNDFRIKFKTQKCRYLIEKGYCPFGTHCTFAHSDQQVRSKVHISQKYRTKVCHNYSSKGFCPYGSRCHYLHLKQSEEDCTDDGVQTRSNSEESDCSKSSRSEKNSKVWSKMTHSKRIELIQTLGFDYSIRSSSRLMQLLNSNEPDEPSDAWMFEDIAPKKESASLKKYSL